MKIDTIGDTIEHYASRSALRLLQMLSLFVWAIGWGFSKAGPTIMKQADRVKEHAEDGLGIQRQLPATEGADGLPSDSDKSHISEAPEVSLAEIKDAPVSEEHPDAGAEPSIQINQLSTDSGQEDSSEETPGVNETKENAESSSDDEDGSMPSPAVAGSP